VSDGDPRRRGFGGAAKRRLESSYEVVDGKLRAVVGWVD
jgi:hypothetical protein